MENVRLTKREKRALAKEKKKKERERKGVVKKVTNFAIGLMLIAGLIWGSVKFVRWLNSSPETSQETISVSAEDWIRGSAEGEVVLIEYSDFQCPACVSYYSVVERLAEEYFGKLTVVFRHFPLTSIHTNAFSAARAAEAAGKQGKFWEMHNILFEKQGEWANERNPDDRFKAYAEDLNLDVDRFINDYESVEVEGLVNSDFASARSLGLNSTPSFFINGRKIKNPSGYEAFKEIISGVASE